MGDDASKSAPVKKAKEKTPVKKISRSNSSSRSSSRSPVRLISRSNSSSSSSDNEKESASTENDKKTAPQSGFKNPLFMLNQKNKEGKADEDVKQVLVEKLFSLLSNEENNKEKQENVETAAAEPMDVDKVEKEKPLPLLYASNKESVDVKRIAQMRPFADLLMIETCTGSLSFLGNYRISLKELEIIVHKVIVKLETPRPLEKPTGLPQPSSYEKAKHKIKDFKLQLKDIKDEQKCGAALKVYKAEKDNRIR